MGKMRVTVRLYRIHDLDLITFIELHKLNFQKAMYCALTSFTNGELFFIEIPPKRDEDKQLNLRRVYTMVLTLDEKKDKNTILLLKKINDGRRNNFLKNLLRLYLCNPMSENFLVDEKDSDYFYEKFNIFRSGKRTANLNDTKKRNLIPIQTAQKNGNDISKGEATEIKTETTDEIIAETLAETMVETDLHEKDDTDNIQNDSNNNDIVDLFSSILG